MVSKLPLKTNNLAKKLLDTDLNTNLVFLYGELGSGKTTFVKGMGEKLGIAENDIISPTFVLIKQYPITKHLVFKTLIHVDLYRLKKTADLVNLDLDDLLFNKQNLVVVEWPEILESKIPPAYPVFKIYFKFINPSTREIQYLLNGK